MTDDDMYCCDRGEWSGLIYPDGQKRCWPHATNDDKTLLVDLDQRAAARGLKVAKDSPYLPPLNRAWPYGPNIDVPSRAAMLNWAEQHDLRLANPRHDCLNWLRKGRCTVRDCHGIRPGHRWADHVTGWNRAGKPAVLLAQPYPRLSDEDTAQLTQLDNENGLRVDITGTGWYGHGTVFIGVWRDDRGGGSG